MTADVKSSMGDPPEPNAPQARASGLQEALRSGQFVVTGELGPPAEPDGSRVRAAAAALAPVVHAANVTDNHAASVKMSPLVGAAFMLEAGLDPILQITGRDRNVLALQSDLLGAWALGVRTVLALSGDPLKVGLYEGRATHVRDADSLALARLIRSLNEGRLFGGETIEQHTDFLVAGAANPLVDSAERIEAKLEAGVGLLQTNVVYDVERFRAWFASLVAAGVPQRAPVIVGVMPPRSARTLAYMHERIPGVEVDASAFDRMAGLEGEEAKDEGIRIASRVIAGLRGVEGVTGVHLMAPGWEIEAIPRVVAAAELSPALPGP